MNEPKNLNLKKNFSTNEPSFLIHYILGQQFISNLKFKYVYSIHFPKNNYNHQHQ